MPEFVCDDRPDLLGRCLVEQVVVDDDPPGRAESGHVGVERAGATRGVGDEDVVDRHAVVLGHLQERRLQPALLHRAEAVEHRLDQQRIDERQGHHKRGRRRRADHPPPARQRPGERDEEEQGEQGPGHLQAETFREVGGPAAPRPRRQPVVAPHRLAPRGEGQCGQSDGQQHGQTTHEDLPDPASTERTRGRSHESGAEWGEAQHHRNGQPDRQTQVGRRADLALVRVGLGLLGRAEVAIQLGPLDRCSAQRFPRCGDDDSDSQRRQ